MDKFQAALRDKIAAYGERVMELRDEIAAVSARREELENTLALYAETMQPMPKPQPTTGARSGSRTAFVLKAVRDSGARGLSTGEIYDALEGAGLSMRPTTVRSLLYNRKKDGVVERLEDGRYRFPQSAGNGATPPNIETPTVDAAGVSNESRESDQLG